MKHRQHRIGVRRGVACLGLAAILALTGCQSTQQEQIIEMTLPQRVTAQEEGDGLEVSHIYTYSYATQLDQELEYLLQVAMEYGMDSSYVNDLYQSTGTAGAGFEGEDIFLYFQMDNKIITRRLDMEYGFYEDAMSELFITRMGQRVWISPNGNSRLLKVYDRQMECWCLDWQWEDGSTERLLTDKGGYMLEENELQCVWSGDGNRAFLRLYPKIFMEDSLPEDLFADNYAAMAMDKEAVQKAEKSQKNRDLLALDNAVGVWMVQAVEGNLTVSYVGESGTDQYWRPCMLASEDGKELFLYTSGVARNRMASLGFEECNDTLYMREEENGQWISFWDAEEGISWQRDDSRVDIPVGGYYTAGCRYAMGDGKVYSWFPLYLEHEIYLCLPEENFRTYQGNLDRDVQWVIPFRPTDSDHDFLYAANGSDIYRYEYNEEENRWHSELIYMGTGELLSMTVQPENGNLLLHYITGEEVKNDQGIYTQNMELVLLTF